MDAVVSYHVDPAGCGVAKFSQQLAGHLGVRHARYGTPAQHPLVSVKFSELPTGVLSPRGYYRHGYDLFLHDLPSEATWPLRHSWIEGADRIWAGDPTLAREAARIRTDVTAVWCPALVRGRADRGAIRVLLFGMAHKRQALAYQHLAHLLTGAKKSWTVSLSMAVHDGQAWHQAMHESIALTKELFGDRLRVLGALADDALADELRRASVAALFYAPAARANNTTLWAAMEAGCPVITNLDADSPPELVHHETVFDLAHLERFPAGRLLRVGQNGRAVAQGRSWEALLQALRR